MLKAEAFGSVFLTADGVDERLEFVSRSGILLVQGDALDRGYLRDRAERLGLSDLLERAEVAARTV